MIGCLIKNNLEACKINSNWKNMYKPDLIEEGSFDSSSPWIEEC
jgi:hypothetical protein